MSENLNILDVPCLTNVPAADITTMGGTGRCKIIFLPENEKQLVFCFDFFSVNDIDFKVIGNGSNIILTKSNKVFLCTKKVKKSARCSGNTVTLPASMTVAAAYKFCQERSLSGFERLAGVPGTIGGAIMMNASAFGDCISDWLESVRILKGGKIQTIKKQNIDFSYRTSSIDGLILSAKSSLQKKDKCQIHRDFLDCVALRSQLQPKGRSSGSIFKNPPGFSAGQLIDICGLKGTNIGGAKISEKHANFIINENNADASDIEELIKLAKNAVMERFNVSLECEVEFV